MATKHYFWVNNGVTGAWDENDGTHYLNWSLSSGGPQDVPITDPLFGTSGDYALIFDANSSGGAGADPTSLPAATITLLDATGAPHDLTDSAVTAPLTVHSLVVAGGWVWGGTALDSAALGGNATYPGTGNSALALVLRGTATVTGNVNFATADFYDSSSANGQLNGVATFHDTSSFAGSVAPGAVLKFLDNSALGAADLSGCGAGSVWDSAGAGPTSITVTVGGDGTMRLRKPLAFTSCAVGGTGDMNFLVAPGGGLLLAGSTVTPRVNALSSAGRWL